MFHFPVDKVHFQSRTAQLLTSYAFVCGGIPVRPNPRERHLAKS
jgi:hypothetical protein